ncbi:MAG: hypothetical protein DMG26_18535 [Acidobacteria bacterium]|nr:MAG: hypothetical protein DMG26_18535 [Acidobacteriota bacterium]
MSLVTALGAVVLVAACRELPAPPKPYLAFVANNQSNSVAAVDLANFRLVATIPVAPGPEQVTVRPRSREVWVLGGPSGIVSVIRFPELDVRKSFRVGPLARSLTFSRDGRRAFVFSPAEGQVVFLDCDQLRETARVRLRAPSMVRFSENLATENPALSAVVAMRLGEVTLTPDGKVLVISDAIALEKLLGSVDVGKNPGPMVVLPDSSKVFVADTGEPKVSAVDIASRQLLSHLETAARPSALLLKPDGGEIFVLSALGSSLSILDAFHDNVEQNMTTGREPSAAVIRRNQSVLYIANAGDGSVTALEVENRTVLSSTHAGTEPRSLALTPDERYLVVADAASSDVAILRTDVTDAPPSGPTPTSRTALVTTVPVGARPVSVVIPDWLWQK